MKNQGINWPKDQTLFPHSKRVVVMDVETMNPYADIIQIAAVEVVNNKIARQLFKNIRPMCRKFNPYCAKVHGISLDDVRHEKTFMEFSPELVDFVGKSPIVAHNRPAEYKSLLFEYDQFQKKFPFYIGDFYCSMKMAKSLNFEGKLRNMAEKAGIKTSHLRTEHDALSDTLVASELYIRMQNIRNQ